jgi:hypothetical protein
MKKTILKDIKSGDTFVFASNDDLTLRGGENAVAVKNRYAYITVCEGTCPKVECKETGDVFILSHSAYYREVLEPINEGDWYVNLLTMTVEQASHNVAANWERNMSYNDGNRFLRNDYRKVTVYLPNPHQ